MAADADPSDSDRPHQAARGRVPRGLVVGAWAVVVAAFWATVLATDGGPLDTLAAGLDVAAAGAWAPWALLAAYALRPLLLIPITVINLASGFFLGAWPGLAVAMTGTLLSASIGYGLGAGLRSSHDVERWAGRWRFVTMLRRRGFESVVAGGLMYLHADMVNLPAGLLRIPVPRFLAGIVIGNALMLTTAVLTGAAVDGTLADARFEVDVGLLAAAGALFAFSLALAAVLRKRLRPVPHEAPGPGA